MHDGNNASRLAEEATREREAKARWQVENGGKSKEARKPAMSWSQAQNLAAVDIENKENAPEELLQTMAWKERNAFLTRRTWHNTSDDGEHQSAGVAE